MCFGQSSQPVDHSAELARKEEQARKGRILTGQENIDKAFTMFDPAYYDRFKTDYVNNYNPQVDKQFDNTKRDLRYEYARKGTLNSTPGVNKFGDLVDLYQQRRNEVSSNAMSATAGLRSGVEQNKAELYQQNTTAADPSLAAQSAVGRVNAMATPAAYSPLADLFAGFVNTAGSAISGNRNALPAGYAPFFAPGYYSYPSSSKVVG